MALRLPKAFLDKRPASFDNNSDWLRSIIFGNELPEGSGLTVEQSEAITYFYKFFNELFEADVLTDYLDRDGLLEMAAVFGGMVNE